MRSWMVVALLAGTALSAAQSAASGTVIEPRSRARFPVSLIPPGGATSHWITGTGLRDRTVFRVQIYAFGLYVDRGGARRVLSSFAGRPASSLERDERFYQRLLDLEFAMTLRLVMARTIEGADARAAFDAALRPRMAAAMRGGGEAAAAATVALQTFGRHFDAAELRKDDEVVFSCDPTGRLTASVKGAERTPVDSSALCRALFDVYLGTDPISNAGKRSVIAGFPELLGRQTP